VGLHDRRKPSLLGGVNGMITGLVGITPAAGYVNGYGAIAIGVVAGRRRSSTSRPTTSAACRPFRQRRRHARAVIYTHGIAGLAGGSSERCASAATNAPPRAVSSFAGMHRISSHSQFTVFPRPA
jgi:ammonia channel protein AmtB